MTNFPRRESEQTPPLRRPFPIWLAVPVLLGIPLTLARPVAAEPSGLAPEAGYNYGEIDTPRSMGTGGAMRSMSNSVTALFMNPANMAATHVYHIATAAQIYPEAGRQSYGGGIVDSVVSSSNLAGGVGGTWNLQDPEGSGREWIDLRGGLALPLGKIAFIGAAGRMFSLTESGPGPLGYSPASGGIPESMIVNTFTLDLGATLRPIPELSVSLTGHNLTATGHGFLPIMGGASISYATPDFGVAVDAVLDGTTYNRAAVRIMAGGEALVAGVLALRLGYRFDEGLETHSLAWGAGYFDRKFALDVGVRRGVSGPEYTAIVMGISLHIDALTLGMDPID
jgi:hypothetical protein